MASVIDKVGDLLPDLSASSGPRTYIRWDDPQVEPEVPNEADLVDEIKGLINSVQKQNFDSHRHG